MSIKPILSLLAVGALLSGCESFVYLKSKGDTGLVGGGKPVLYDDFEKSMGGAWNYGDTSGGGACNAMEESTTVHGGSKAAKIDYKSGSGTWGCGSGWTSNQMPKEGYFDCKGTLGIEFWAKGPIGANFQFSVKEGGQNGGDSEVYLGPWVTGTGRWKKYYVKFESFTRGIYSGNQSGDDALNPAALSSIDIQLQEKQGDGSLYVDDIWFK